MSVRPHGGFTMQRYAFFFKDALISDRFRYRYKGETKLLKIPLARLFLFISFYPKMFLSENVSPIFYHKHKLTQEHRHVPENPDTGARPR